MRRNEDLNLSLKMYGRIISPQVSKVDVSVIVYLWLRVTRTAPQNRLKESNWLLIAISSLICSRVLEGSSRAI